MQNLKLKLLVDLCLQYLFHLHWLSLRHQKEQKIEERLTAFNPLKTKAEYEISLWNLFAFLEKFFCNAR